MKTAILTDTNSGINVKEAASMGIHVLGMPVIVDGKTLYENNDMTSEELCHMLMEGHAVSTSQPAIGDVVAKWDELSEMGYDEIVYIPMSSGLSSSCMCAGGMALDYEGRVHVVDNHRISVTQRISVMRAKSLAESGEDGSSIKRILEDESYDSSIYVSVSNIDFLKKGGRITPAVAMVASAFAVKPVMTIQGEKLDRYAVIRGRIDRCETKMIEAIRKDIEDRFAGPQFGMLHIGAAGFGIDESQKTEWLERVREAFPDADVFYNDPPASIGTHTGPGAVGIGVSADRFQ